MPVGNLDVIIDRIHRLKKCKGSVSSSSDSVLANSNDAEKQAGWRSSRVPLMTGVPRGRPSHRPPSSRRSSQPYGRRRPYRDIEYLLSGSDTEETGDPQLSHLESLECFAAHFRRKRIMLGYTQQQVGDTLGRRYNAYFSQTTISRFEDLNLSVRNMGKLRPLIERWIIDTERALEDGLTSMEVETTEKEEEVCDSSSGRRRRKRTTIDDQMKSFLENVFKGTQRPTALQIDEIASQLSLRAEVVRVWFCNRRQREMRSLGNKLNAAPTAGGHAASSEAPNSPDDQSYSNEPPKLQPYFVASSSSSSQGVDRSVSSVQEQLEMEHQYALKVKSQCPIPMT